MELAANVWPVMDDKTGLVLRFLARAYVFDAADEVISSTLRALAPTDFRLASAFAIPQRYVVHSEHGAIRGCVHIRDFQEYQSEILERAFRVLEADFGKLQAVGIDPKGEAHGIGLMPRFPAEPYVLVTTLLETREGQLMPLVDER